MNKLIELKVGDMFIDEEGDILEVVDIIDNHYLLKFLFVSGKSGPWSIGDEIREDHGDTYHHSLKELVSNKKVIKVLFGNINKE